MAWSISRRAGRNCAVFPLSPIHQDLIPSSAGLRSALGRARRICVPEPSMRLSLRFVLPLLLVLAAVAYGVTQLADRLDCALVRARSGRAHCGGGESGG